MRMDMSKPETTYARIFFTLIRRQADTMTFRRLVRAGEPLAKAQASGEDTQLANDILKDPKYDEYFLDRQKAVEFFGGTEALANSWTQGKISTLRGIVDLASVVVMHSALDAALTDLCRLAATMKPSDWEERISDKQIKLASVKTTPYETLLRERLHDHLAALEKESMLKRTEALLAVCQPPAGYVGVNGYTWDRTELARIDQLRHDLIHGRLAAPPPTEVERDIEFLVKTGLYFWTMLNAKYNVKVDLLFELRDRFPSLPG